MRFGPTSLPSAKAEEFTTSSRRIRYIYDSGKNVTQNIWAIMMICRVPGSSNMCTRAVSRHIGSDISCWPLEGFGVKAEPLHGKIRELLKQYCRQERRVSFLDQS